MGVFPRKNALHLQEKERIERERLQQIIDDADDYKDELLAKRKTNREANIKKNRDQEKVIWFSVHSWSMTVCWGFSIVDCTTQWDCETNEVHGKVAALLG